MTGLSASARLKALEQILIPARIVPVLTIDRVEDAVPLAQALVAGGVNVLEVTFRTEVAATAAKAIIAEVPGAIVGMGTVLSGDDLRRGQFIERGELVVYYGRATKERKNDNGDSVEDSFRFLKCYTAFNAEQTDGLDARFFPQPIEQEIMPIATHETWYAGLDIPRILTQDIACYIPSKDVIGMPPLAAFDSREDYAATLNHEAVHATGAAHRVGRDMSKRFSGHALAAEELVAEIGASILGAHLSLPPEHLHDHASYIGHWMKLLKDDKRAFLAAAAQAQSAVDWLLAKSPVSTEYAQVDDAETRETFDVGAVAARRGPPTAALSLRSTASIAHAVAHFRPAGRSLKEKIVSPPR